MADEARVHHAIVRRYVRAGLQDREQNRRAFAVREIQRNLLQRRRGRGAARAILFHLASIFPEIEGAPIRIVEQMMILRAEMSAGAFDVGTEARLIFGEDGAEFILDHWSLGFQIRHPVERAGIIELDLGQAGEIVAPRFLQEDALPAEQDVERLMKSCRALVWRDQTIKARGIV